MPSRATRREVASRRRRIILGARATCEFNRITRSLAGSLPYPGVSAGDSSNCRQPGVVEAFRGASLRSAALLQLDQQLSTCRPYKTAGCSLETSDSVKSSHLACTAFNVQAI